MIRQRTGNGFTIVELMIATAVLSTLLVIVTMVIAGIGNLYFKGVSQSQVQSAARAIVDDVSNRIKMSNGSLVSGTANGSFKAYCIGTTRYSYIIGARLDSAATKHVLWRDTVNDGTCTAADLSQDNPSRPPASFNGTELAAPNSRLNRFVIARPPDAPFFVDVSLIVGPDDLICSPTAAAGDACKGAAMTAPDYQKGDLRCLPSSESKYCAVSQLSTVVTQRL